MILIFTHQRQKFLKTLGKGEIATIQGISPFPQYFQLNQIIVSPFVHSFDIISLAAFELEEPKIGISGKGFKKNDQSKNMAFMGDSFSSYGIK